MMPLRLRLRHDLLEQLPRPQPGRRVHRRLQPAVDVRGRDCTDGFARKLGLEQMREVFAVFAPRRRGERHPVLAARLLHIRRRVIPEHDRLALLLLLLFGVAFAWVRPCRQSGLLAFDKPLFPREPSLGCELVLEHPLHDGAGLVRVLVARPVALPRFVVDDGSPLLLRPHAPSMPWLCT